MGWVGLGQLFGGLGRAGSMKIDPRTTLPVPPGRGSAAGRKFVALPYYSQRAVFASLRALF